MANETKISKTNTFEEWRHKTNEISFDVGGNDLLDERLSNRLYTYNSVSGTNQNIITGNDNTPATAQTLDFEILPDTKLDNTSGYIILADGTSITSLVANSTITQDGGFNASIVSAVTVDNKPKILVTNSTGTFDSTEALKISGSEVVSASNVIRQVTESYRSGSIVVKSTDGSTITTHLNDLSATGYHIPNVSSRITLTGSPTAKVVPLTEGTVVYQGNQQSVSATEAEVAAHASTTFVGTIYHANDNYIYLKTTSGTFNKANGVKLVGLASGSNLAQSYFDVDLEPYGTSTRGQFIEFNSGLSAGLNVTISARDLITVVNELQTDVGKIEDLTTDAADVTLSINELEDAVRGTSADYTLATDSASGLIGGVNELEAASRGDSSATNYTVTTESTEGFAGGINELDTALRSATMQSSNALVSATLTTTANDITTAINEHDAELGTITSQHMGTTASNVGDAIAEIEGQIGTEDISAIDAGDTSNTIYGALNQLHGEIGAADISGISGTDNTISTALNQLHDEVGNVGSGLTGLTATDLTAAVDELRTDIGDVGTSGATLTTNTNIVATDLTAAVVELDTTIGSGVITGVGTEAAGLGNLTSAINAIDAGLGNATSYNVHHYGANTVAESLTKLQSGLSSNDDEIYDIMQAIDGGRPGTIRLVNNATIPASYAAGDVLTQSGGFRATIVAGGINNTNKTINVRDITGIFSSSQNITNSGKTTISANSVNAMDKVDTTISANGIGATTIKGALEELALRQIIAGDGLAGGGNLFSNRTLDIEIAGGGGLSFNVSAPVNANVGATAQWKGFQTVSAIVNTNEKGTKLFDDGPFTNAARVANQKFAVSGSSGNITLAPNTQIFEDDTMTDGVDLNTVIARNSADDDGGIYLEAFNFLENNSWRNRTLTFSGTIDTKTLHSRYYVKAFIKYLNSDDDYNLIEEVEVDLKTAANDTFSISLAIPDGGNIVPQVGFVVGGVNTSATDQAAIAGTSIVASNVQLSVSAAAGGGQLAVDSSVIRTGDSGGTALNQTFNSNINFSSSNTLTFPAGSTLDVSAGSILIGGGGEVDVAFDTAFLKLQAGTATHGVKVDRSQAAMGALYSNLIPSQATVISAGNDAEIKWNEGQVIAAKGHRAWQVTGLTSGATPSAQTVDLVTFYNAGELLANTSEITTTWDANANTFSSALGTSGVTAGTVGSATSIPVITVDNKGRITATSTAAITTTMNIAADSGDDRAIDLAADTFTIAGTSSEITTTMVADDDSTVDTIQIGLPASVTVSSNLTVSGAAASTSSTTGALTVAGGAGIGGDLYVGGNLQVDGTQTIFNTETITVDDNIIVLNDNKEGDAGTEKAGIEIERGNDANVQLRWNDDGDVWELTVDGTNYSTIITEATDYDNWVLASGTTGGTANISNGNTVTFSAGTGLTTSRSSKTITYAHADTSTVATVDNSDGNVLQDIGFDTFGHVTSVASTDLDTRYIRSFDVRDGDGTEKVITQNEVFKFKELTGDGATIDINFQTDGTIGTGADEQVSHILGFKITNNDKGSGQNIFKNVAVNPTIDGGHTFTDTGTIAAGSNTDTFTFYPDSGIDIDVDATNKSIKIKNTSLGSNQNIFKTIKAFNHGEAGTQIGSDITAGSNSSTLNFKEVQKSSTTGIELSIIGTDTIGIAHADTSTQANISNTGTTNKFIQNLTFDAYGHVTGQTSGTVSIGNGVLTLAGGTLLHINEDDKSFSANQIGNQTITLDHDAVTRTNTTATSTLSASGTFTAITGLTSSAEGHITGAETKTYTLPADNNTTYSAHAGGGLKLVGNPSTQFKLNGAGIGNNVDLNTHTTTGYFVQATNDNVNEGNNYPPIPGIATNDANNTAGAGVLHVINAHDLADSTGSPTAHIIQTYYEYNTTNVWVRYYYTNTWTAWRNLAQDTNTNTQLTTAQVRGKFSGSGVNTSTGVITNTQYSVGDNGLTQKNFTTTLKNKLDAISASADVNQSAFSHVQPMYNSENYGTKASADSATDTLTLNGLRGMVVNGTDNDLLQIFPAHNRTYDSGTTDQVIGHTFHKTMYDVSYGIRWFSGASAATEVMRLLRDSGDLHVKGNIIAYSSTVPSDERLKDNIEVVDNALDKVSQLKGVTFDWKKDGKKSAGLIAQDVEKVLPSAIYETEVGFEDPDQDSEPYKVVAYSQVTSLLVEAIKELKEENKLLRADLEELKSINNK